MNIRTHEHFGQKLSNAGGENFAFQSHYDY